MNLPLPTGRSAPAGLAFRDIAIVGRPNRVDAWTRTFLESDPTRRLHLVSLGDDRDGPTSLDLRDRPPTVTTYHTLDDLVARGSPPLFLTTAGTVDDGSLMRALVELGADVVVDGPIARSAERVVELLEKAGRDGVTLCSTDMMLAAHLGRTVQRHLRTRSTDHETSATKVDEVHIVWQDSIRGAPDHRSRPPEVSFGPTSAMLPAALCAINALLGPGSIDVERLETADGGMTIAVHLRHGEVPILVELGRLADEQQRRIGARVGSEVLQLDLDQALERASRAHLSAPHRTDEADSDDCSHRAETSRQISALLTQDAATLAPLIDLPTVETLADVNRRVTEQQRHDLLSAVRTATPTRASRWGLYLHLVPILLDDGMVDDADDSRRIDHLVDAAHEIIVKMANDPFAHQEEIASRLGHSADELRPLNAALRRCELAQDVIVNGGSGSKYYTNTVLPLVASGTIDRTLDGVADFPHRVGVYAGQSCMFECSFCGRARGAAYLAGQVPSGNERLKALFDEAPKDDPQRFYLSGGLEPLTNRGLGDLITYGAERGFELSLYTNAFMLTQRLLDRQPGLWDLASLRVSLYGVDEASSTAVTGRAGSFGRVIDNATNFLAARNARDSSLKLGFNYVLLPGQSESLKQLAELLAAVNRRGGGRQIDFLTLREDYSTAPGEGIDAEERARLDEIFVYLDDRLSADDLCDLHIDYGYSLDAVRRGHVGSELRMVTGDGMRPEAYPALSVVVDLLGDVYAYREAGFLDREGADRYILDRLADDRTMRDIVADWIDRGGSVEPLAGDTAYFDTFDHVVTRLLNQAEADRRFGVPFETGPVAGRMARESDSADPTGRFEHAHFAVPTRALETNRGS